MFTRRWTCCSSLASLSAGRTPRGAAAGGSPEVLESELFGDTPARQVLRPSPEAQLGDQQLVSRPFDQHPARLRHKTVSGPVASDPVVSSAESAASRLRPATPSTWPVSFST